jgi:hypothetical protein
MALFLNLSGTADPLPSQLADPQEPSDPQLRDWTTGFDPVTFRTTKRHWHGTAFVGFAGIDERHERNGESRSNADKWKNK